MHVQFSFKHMETSPALQNYTEQKVKETIRKFVTKPIEAHVTFSVEKHQHRAHCSFRAGDGFDVEVEHTCDDMYGSVDHMLNKLATQLKRHKEKLKNHKNKRSSRELLKTAEVVEDELDAEDLLKLEEARKRVNS